MRVLPPEPGKGIYLKSILTPSQCSEPGRSRSRRRYRSLMLTTYHQSPAQVLVGGGQWIMKPLL